MLWMTMPGQGGLSAAAMFMQMWTAMTFMMMAPMIFLALWLDWQAGDPRVASWGWARAAAGYFAIWMLCGLAVYGAASALMGIRMRVDGFSNVNSWPTGALLLGGALYQLSPFKLRRLQGCCCGRADWPCTSSWSYGTRLGLECFLCCAGLTAMMLALGRMDPVLMAAFGLAMLAERTLRGRQRWSRVIGVGALLFAGSQIAALAAPLVSLAQPGEKHVLALSGRK